MLSVTILGNNSAVPAYNRHPTSQVVQTMEHTFLLDCGEGTQMQMNSFKIKKSKINHIFISHLHGDHYFGLIGLITSFGLNHRTNELHIHAPEQLKKIIEIQLNISNVALPYSIIYHDLHEEGVIFEDGKIQVENFKVNHRIECWGYLFREKRNPRKINPEKVEQYMVPTSYYDKLQKGEDFIAPGGNIIQNDQLTTDASLPKAYAYSADTTYYEPIISKIKGVDLLYHESTYLSDLEEKAVSRFHSTAKQAAQIAKKAGVKKLILGHFSSIYENPDVLKNEACEVFEKTEIASEGTCFIV